MTLLATQPFKAVYVLGAVAFGLARLPIWLLKYLTSYGRQHPKWSFGQALRMRLLYTMVDTISTVQAHTPEPTIPGPEKDRWTMIKFNPEWNELYKGPMLAAAATSNVVPIDIGGTWYTKDRSSRAALREGDDMQNVLVVLHMHGGAYVVGDGRTETFGYFANKYLTHTPVTHVFAPQYRLSKLPDTNPFPAALQDCLTAYLYLHQTLGIPVKNIVLAGDSAGANCAIGFLRYIAEYGAEIDIPAPSTALLWSPWINPSTNVASTLRANPNFPTDMLAPSFLSWGHRAFAGKAGAQQLKTPYVDLSMKPFVSETRMWVNAGTAEALFFEVGQWVDMMRKVEGAKTIELDLEEGAPHDVCLLGKDIGFDEAAGRQAKRAGKWLEGVR